ncbi:MAG: hypothetical protein K2N58_02220 [Treponemataceae bacterium]|nr:hypothetical protein [Treponemataceae bacterium]
MPDILISIKPKYVDKILTHKKRFEFRTKVCKQKIEKLYIYSSYPVCKIVGYAFVSNVISDTPQNLWKRTFEYAGISSADFFSYFNGRCTAFAYALDKVEVFDHPKTLTDFGIKRPPQNFLYLI